MGTSERGYFLALGAVALIGVAVAVIWARPWAAPESPLARSTASATAGTVRTATATSSRTATATGTATATATAAPTETATPSASPTAVTTVAPVVTPQPTPPAPPLAPSFTGSWRIVDTVRQGAGAGTTLTFDVVITQSGSRLEGGGDGLQLAGIVQGSVATVQFAQPSLGYTGTFTWTLDTSGHAIGTFTSTVPNSGTSELLRTR